MTQAGQDLPFGLEARRHLRRVQAPAQHLDGHLLAVSPVGAVGQVDGAHAALGQVLSHGVRPQILSYQGIGGRIQIAHHIGQSARHAVQEVGILPVGLEQAQHFQGQLGIALATAGHEGAARFGYLLEGGLEEVLYPAPAILLGRAHGFISRCNQAWARRQSRRTVGSLTPSTSAVSSCFRPPKKRSSTTWR